LEEEQQFICQHFFSFFESENMAENLKIGNQNNNNINPQKFMDNFILKYDQLKEISYSWNFEKECQ